jgi:hypothetical protein
LTIASQHGNAAQLGTSEYSAVFAFDYGAEDAVHWSAAGIEFGDDGEERPEIV